MQTASSLSPAYCTHAQKQLSGLVPLVRMMQRKKHRNAYSTHAQKLFKGIQSALQCRRTRRVVVVYLFLFFLQVASCTFVVSCEYLSICVLCCAESCEQSAAEDADLVWIWIRGLVSWCFWIGRVCALPTFSFFGGIQCQRQLCKSDNFLRLATVSDQAFFIIAGSAIALLCADRQRLNYLKVLSYLKTWPLNPRSLQKKKLE